MALIVHPECLLRRKDDDERDLDSFIPVKKENFTQDDCVYVQSLSSHLSELVHDIDSILDEKRPCSKPA